MNKREKASHRGLKHSLIHFLQNPRSPTPPDSYFASCCFIISSPRAGSTLLVELLAKHLDANVSLKESHAIYQLPNFRYSPEQLNHSAVSAQQCNDFKKSLLFLHTLNQKNIVNHTLPTPKPFIEKTPKHLVLTPFLQKIFPSTRFLFLQRDAKDTIASMIEGWLISAKSHQFVTHQQAELAGWHLPFWCFVLLPNWRDYIGKNVIDIVVAQWIYMMRCFLKDSDAIAPENLIVIEYKELITNPTAVLNTIASKLDTSLLANQISLDIKSHSKTTVSPPKPEKWRRYERQLEPYLSDIQAIEQRLNNKFK